MGRSHIFCVVWSLVAATALVHFDRTDEDLLPWSQLIDESSLQLRPDSWDAESKLEAAFELARKTSREVWVTRTDPRSPRSIALRRWQEAHRETLEKAFVLISLELIRDSYSENYFDLNQPSENVVLNSFGRVIWFEPASSDRRDKLEYSALDPEILKPLLESATTHPFDSDTISRLLE